MENEKINEVKNKNKEFLKDKKNIAIIILSIISFCALCFCFKSLDTYKYEGQINDLQSQITELQNDNNQLKIENTSLEKEKLKLEETTKSLEEQKNTLENEKQELTQKVDELAKAKEEKEKATTIAKTSQPSNPQASSSSTAPSNPSTTSTIKNNPSPATTSSGTTSSVQTNTDSNNSQTVWIGDTGTKYHVQSCRTLKGKGHPITMQQALAEGRQACKVCH